MRQKRAKAYRKLMHLYCMNFGFRQTYQVLVDSQMCSESVTQKIDLTKQLATVLQGSVKPMITQCSIHVLYLAGRDAQPAVDLAKIFERRRCNHREAVPEAECVRDVLGTRNAHRYVLAAQSPEIRRDARAVPATPLVHVKRGVMVLEPVSEATARAKEEMEDGRQHASKAEAGAVKAAKEEAVGAAVSEAPAKKKRKGPPGPNPLSVKKKKSKADEARARVPAIDKGKKREEGAENSVGQKRKRGVDEEGDEKVNGQREEGSNVERGDAKEGIDTVRKKRRRRKHGKGGQGEVEVEESGD